MVVRCLCILVDVGKYCGCWPRHVVSVDEVCGIGCLEGQVGGEMAAIDMLGGRGNCMRGTAFLRPCCSASAWKQACHFNSSELCVWTGGIKQWRVVNVVVGVRQGWGLCSRIYLAARLCGMV